MDIYENPGEANKIQEDQRKSWNVSQASELWQQSTTIKERQRESMTINGNHEKQCESTKIKENPMIISEDQSLWKSKRINENQLKPPKIKDNQ